MKEEIITLLTVDVTTAIIEKYKSIKTQYWCTHKNAVDVQKALKSSINPISLLRFRLSQHKIKISKSSLLYSVRWT